jgi:hypothetical protein
MAWMVPAAGLERVNSSAIELSLTPAGTKNAGTLLSGDKVGLTEDDDAPTERGRRRPCACTARRSIEEIAHQLESRPDTVRGWIERRLASGPGVAGKRERQVDQRTVARSHHLYQCVTGNNPVSPGLMTTTERLDGIAEILARGLLRLRRRQSTNNYSNLEKNSLDFPPDRSVHATTGKRRKVAR